MLNIWSECAVYGRRLSIEWPELLLRAEYICLQMWEKSNQLVREDARAKQRLRENAFSRSFNSWLSDPAWDNISLVIQSQKKSFVSHNHREKCVASLSL